MAIIKCSRKTASNFSARLRVLASQKAPLTVILERLLAPCCPRTFNRKHSGNLAPASQDASAQARLW
jgi:hypothetical protein